MTGRGGAEAELLAAMAADPGRAGLLTDFDGTLTALVADPASSRPLAGVEDVLAVLGPRLGVVAVVSGRPVSFLVSVFGAPSGHLLLSGMYGLESARADVTGGWVVSRHPDAEAWAPVVADVVGQAREAAPPGVLVEDKGLGLTVHWRTGPEHERWVRDWTSAAAARTGLVVHPAKASAELRVPVARDKGTVVAELTEGLETVCYLGDDVGDLPAIEMVRRRPPGRGWVVVVGGAETPAAVVDLAHLVVEGPPGALTLLQDLATALD